MKKLILVAGMLLALSAYAVTHSISGTIDTPAVVTWVDGGGASIATYFTSGVDQLYLDTGTGYVWRIQDVMTSPTTVGQAPINGLFYTSVNCTGTPYLLLPSSDVPKTVHVTEGSPYVAGSAAGVTVHSQLLNAACYVDTETVGLYAAIGPLTPPTLASGPWHLEAR